MSETPKAKAARRRLRCKVVMTEKTIDITPCTALYATFTDKYSGAGVRIAHMINMHDRGIRSMRLVLAPPKKIGNGMVANFCPMCGTVLTKDGNGFAQEKEP